MTEPFDEDLASRLATDAGVRTYVEEELDQALSQPGVLWHLDGIRISRTDRRTDGWRWRHREPLRGGLGGRWTASHQWIISHATKHGGNIELYYDLCAYRAPGLLYVTHSRVNAGIWSPEFLVREATVIAFQGLVARWIKPLQLHAVIRRVMEEKSPNLDWPT